jgi:hypothetical protein
MFVFSAQLSTLKPPMNFLSIHVQPCATRHLYNLYVLELSRGNPVLCPFETLKVKTLLRIEPPCVVPRIEKSRSRVAQENCHMFGR